MRAMLAQLLGRVSVLAALWVSVVGCGVAPPTPAPTPPLLSRSATATVPVVATAEAPRPTATVQPAAPAAVATAPTTLAAPTGAPVTDQRRLAELVRVVDGDTVELRLDGRTERVRLIGIDAPELIGQRRSVDCLGRQASAKSSELLPEGARVEVEGDRTQDVRDRYGRLLLYLWTPGGVFFNQEMIRLGLAQEYTYERAYRYQAEFRAAQAEAQRAQRGQWAPGVCAAEEPTRAPRVDWTPLAVAPQIPMAPAPAPTILPARSPTSPPAPSPTLVPAPSQMPVRATAAPSQMPAPATAAPASANPPPPATGLTITREPGRVERGLRATVAVRTAPNIACSIEVRYRTAASRAQGLNDKVSSASGDVSWTWVVGTSTTTGSWPVAITCGSSTVRTVVTVV